GRRLVFALRKEQAQLFYRVIERGIEAGEFTTPFPRECARSIIATGVAVSTWFDETGPLSRSDMVSRSVTLALATAQATTTSPALQG
uniref:hypothetical protein n=1 Tax=Pseudactinotalea sp. TaxID=1926260 RepID=UPI003B3B96A2